MLRDCLGCHTANLIHAKDKLYTTSCTVQALRQEWQDVLRDNITCSLLFAQSKWQKNTVQATKHHMQFSNQSSVKKKKKFDKCVFVHF